MLSDASSRHLTAYPESPVRSATSASVSPLSLSRSISRMPNFSISLETWNTMGPQAMNSACRCASRAESCSEVYLRFKSEKRCTVLNYGLITFLYFNLQIYELFLNKQQYNP